MNNKKAYFNYTIIDKLEAGIMLMGSEMKPLLANKASISDSYIWIDIKTNSVWIENMYIKNENNNAYSHEEIRRRKLLLTKKQIKNWKELMEQNRYTIVPLCGKFDSNHRFKLTIGLAKGKKLVDKRNSLKEKDDKKRIDRELKKY